MKSLFCDLHIHSCLSPCGDALMTPNNIVGMAFIKQLDVIAVCDHNSARNLPAIKEAADMMNVLLLPQTMQKIVLGLLLLISLVVFEIMNQRERRAVYKKADKASV